MRGLLIVNPRATTTSHRVTDVIIHALSDELDLDVTVTSSRGHATELGERARQERMDLVITLGGDGIINEAVNGMLAQGPGPEVPILATVPGGSANVFARALGLAADPVEATGQLLDGIRERRVRTIGLGRANGRWFTVNAGLGLDAEIIAAMEDQRRAGHSATPGRYLGTTLRQLLRTDRRHPALSLLRPGFPPIRGVYLVIVQNTAPWTYLGARPVDPCPQASFETGLDAFALRSLHLPSALRAAGRMLTRSRAGSTRSAIVVWHDQVEFTVEASRPIPMQVDGEGAGIVTRVTFEAAPLALRAIC